MGIVDDILFIMREQDDLAVKTQHGDGGVWFKHDYVVRALTEVQRDLRKYHKILEALEEDDGLSTV